MERRGCVSTLIAYIVLAVLAYIVNQRIYPVPFEIGRFFLAVLVGVIIYLWKLHVDIFYAIDLANGLLALEWYYDCIRSMAHLSWTIGYPSGLQECQQGRRFTAYKTQYSHLILPEGGTMERKSHTAVVEKPKNTSILVKPKVCMHVLGIGRTDARVLREAKALEQAGYDVVIIDIEEKHTRPDEENFNGIRFRHFFMATWYIPTHFKFWFLVKVVRVFISATFMLLRTPAEIYHAHEDNALFACYVAACLHRKPLIFDSHELPFVSPRVTRWRLLHACATRLLKAMLPRCAAVISPSPPLVHELQRRYGGREAVIIRNIPPYQPPIGSDRLRQHLTLEPQTRIALYQGGLQDDRGLDIFSASGALP